MEVRKGTPWLKARLREMGRTPTSLARRLWKTAHAARVDCAGGALPGIDSANVDRRPERKGMPREVEEVIVDNDGTSPVKYYQASLMSYERQGGQHGRLESQGQNADD